MTQLTTEEKKSMAWTTGVVGLLLLVLMLIRFVDSSTIAALAGGGGGGVEINFGDSDFGMGNDYMNETLNVTDASKKAITKQQSIVEEEILAQENVTDVREYTVVKKTNPVKEKPKNTTTQVVQNKPKDQLSDLTKNALSSFSSGNNSGGDGDDNIAGNKGKRDGSLTSSNYYGDGGSGGGSGGGHGTGTGTGIGAGSGTGTGGGNGYSLAGRKAVTRPLPQNNCNEAGTIVVQVTVDRNGNVVKAIPGFKGSTNSSSCLLNIAKEAALKTKWEAKSSAPDSQIGSIVYNFKLR